MFCKKCGNKLEEGSLFCDQCGEPVLKRTIQNNKTPINKKIVTKNNQTATNNADHQNIKESESNSHISKSDILIFLVIIVIIGTAILLVINNLYPKTDNDANDTTTTTQIETTTQPETTEPEESYDDLYYDCINKIYKEYGKDSKYAFYDFNKDGIDELIVSYGKYELEWVNKVYIINDGKIYSAGTFPKQSTFYIDENDEGIYAIWSKQGCGLIQHITMEDGDNQITVEDTESQDYSSYESNEPLENNHVQLYLDNY